VDEFGNFLSSASVEGFLSSFSVDFNGLLGIEALPNLSLLTRWIGFARPSLRIDFVLSIIPAT